MRIRPRLRTKLLLLSLALLVIPWVGYRYVQEMEAYLRNGQEQALLATARAVATVLHEQPEMFQRQADVLSTARAISHLYLRPLNSPIQLDGYADDWVPYQDRAQTYGKEHILESHTPYRASSLSFTHLIGTYDHYLYALFEVTDDHIVYRDPNSLRLDQSDHLQIALQGPDGKFHRYLLTTTAPGWVNAFLMSDDPNDPVPKQPEIRIKGEWQESATGYTLEIRMPLSMVGDKLAFAIADVDDPRSRTVETVIGTSGTRHLDELGTVTVPSPRMEALLKGLEHNAGRIWVVDRDRRVLALAGSLSNPSDPDEENDDGGGLLDLLYGLILKQPANEFRDERSAVSRLQGPDLETALTGKPDTRWRQTPDRRVAILSAAYPVWTGDHVMGAVVAEQTSNSILILQNRAMENLINLSLVVFLTSTLLLLGFATRLSSRVRRLRDEAERAIGPDGRVRGPLRRSRAGDEIGDLSRTFSEMLERLGQYTRYLESMAGKLSHELRTPMAVVRSSLDNLELTQMDAEDRVYVHRAREGIERLNNILTRMSEATRLEKALQQAEREPFDLRTLVTGCVEGYRLAHPQQEFRLELPPNPIAMNGVPDLIAQMLDKLIANAVDFRSAGTAIELTVAASMGAVDLSVQNQGPPLPVEMRKHLFDSMVSVRQGQEGEAHLGLGLYIVRLIAEFHGGQVAAADADTGNGARFTVRLPLTR